MKWNNHIKYLSSKLNTNYCMISSLKNITSQHHESKRIFRLQKKVIRIIGGIGRRASCRNLFKTLNILPLPCLYISETVCEIKSNMEKMKYNREIYDHCTRQKSDLHTQFCRITLFKNNSANMGIKLYNKLPYAIKNWIRCRNLKEN